MTVAVVVLAIVALTAVVLLLAVQRSSRRTARELARRVDDARAALAASERSHAEDRARLEDLTEAHGGALDGGGAADASAVDGDGGTADGATVEPAALTHASGVLLSLWALTALGRARERRFAEALSTAPPPSSGSSGLRAALEDEVARIREEIGTPGTLRMVLDPEPAPGDAELLLRAVQALLAVLTRHCQAYDLLVHQWEERLLVVLVCDAFDGPEAVAEETSEVLAALVPVGGRVELDRDTDDRLRARLSLPSAPGAEGRHPAGGAPGMTVPPPG